MKKEFSNPVMAVTYFVSESILTASMATTVADTITGGGNSTLTLGGQTTVDRTKVFEFAW